MATGARRDGWQQPVEIPEDLAWLQGPLTGDVRLPLHVHSSGAGPERMYHLDDEDERRELHQVVLAEDLAEDVCCYLNLAELIRIGGRSCGCRPTSAGHGSRDFAR